MIVRNLSLYGPAKSALLFSGTGGVFIIGSRAEVPVCDNDALALSHLHWIYNSCVQIEFSGC